MTARRFTTSLLAVVASLTLTTGASRADIQVAERFESGVWKGAAYRDAESGDFSHCSLYASYDGGQVLVLLRTDRGFSVAIGDPEWDLDAGTGYELLLGIGAGWARSVNGVVVTERVVRVDFGEDPATIDAFRQGEVLSVLGEGRAFRFELKETPRALKDLESCYTRHLRRPAPRPVGPAPSPEPPPAVVAVATAGMLPAALPDRLPSAALTLDAFSALVRLAALGEGESGVPEGRLGFAHYYFFIPGHTLVLYWEEDSSETDIAAVLRRTLDLWRSECPAPVESGVSGQEERRDARVLQGFVDCAQANVAGYVAVTVIDFGAVAQVLAVAVEGPEREAAETLARRFYELEIGPGQTRSL
jgi:hypothetical protein